MQIELALMSEQGGRDYNEDACGHWHSERYLCCVLADGAGGHGGGDIASKLAVSHVLQGYASLPAHHPQALEALLADTNRELLAQRAANPQLRNMHSTVVVLSIDLQERTALWGHCGDSRFYAFRDGVLAQRTRDHSLVQSLIDGGLLDEAGARVHPKRSELYSALGTQGEDLHISVAPQPWPLEGREALMLCTDGLWEWLTDDEIAIALSFAAEPQAWLNDLGQRVRLAAADKPNHDNFTGLALWLRPD
ncbi:PP2C family protein-serine/threonine phosphatase [Roseateles sp. P5_D6]